MGAPSRHAVAVHLPSQRTELAGGRKGADQHAWHGGGVAFQNRAGQATAPIFLLVPQVKLRKRLDLARDAEKVARSVPGLIVEKWVER
jgi:hypothetical protein